MSPFKMSFKMSPCHLKKGGASWPLFKEAPSPPPQKKGGRYLKKHMKKRKLTRKKGGKRKGGAQKEVKKRGSFFKEAWVDRGRGSRFRPVSQAGKFPIPPKFGETTFRQPLVQVPPRESFKVTLRAQRLKNFKTSPFWRRIFWNTAAQTKAFVGTRKRSGRRLHLDCLSCGWSSGPPDTLTGTLPTYAQAVLHGVLFMGVGWLF